MVRDPDGRPFSASPAVGEGCLVIGSESKRGKFVLFWRKDNPVDLISLTLTRQTRPKSAAISSPTIRRFRSGSGSCSPNFWRPSIRRHPIRAHPLGLYLHIPFCRKRCKFCYFRVYTDQNAKAIERYVQALAREVELLSERPPSPGASSNSSISAGARRRI